MLRPTPPLLALIALSGCFVQMNQDGGIIDVDEPFDRVVIDVETGSVDVYGSERELTEVDWDMRWGMGCPEVDIAVHDGVLYVEGSCPAGAWRPARRSR